MSDGELITCCSGFTRTTGAWYSPRGKGLNSGILVHQPGEQESRKCGLLSPKILSCPNQARAAEKDICPLQLSVGQLSVCWLTNRIERYEIFSSPVDDSKARLVTLGSPGSDYQVSGVWKNLLCEVHFWFEHLAVMGRSAFCGSGMSQTPNWSALR